MAARPAAPSAIAGSAHHSSCRCGCKRSQGRVGRLIEDRDTAPLADLGLAIYCFPPEMSRSEETICFPINDAGREFLGLSGARAAA